ncbi:MAG: hypothetical protein EOO59_15170, partial [Hymenobacter sp.]
MLGAASNVATITVLVTGADIATGINGPATATAGSQVTYTVATSNLGTETATNIRPTLQLPAGLTVPASANYTYDAGTGLVTFAASTLASGGAVSNSVSFLVPATGTTSVTGTAGYTYLPGAVVPDPVASNNTAALTTTISGAAAVATSCSTPGQDGPETLTASSTPNTYYPGVSVATVGGVSAITIGAAAGSSTAVAAGDLVLVMQMQGAVITTTINSAAYGLRHEICVKQVDAVLVGQPRHALHGVAQRNQHHATKERPRTAHALEHLVHRVQPHAGRGEQLVPHQVLQGFDRAAHALARRVHYGDRVTLRALHAQQRAHGAARHEAGAQVGCRHLRVGHHRHRREAMLTRLPLQEEAHHVRLARAAGPKQQHGALARVHHGGERLSLFQRQARHLVQKMVHVQLVRRRQAVTPLACTQLQVRVQLRCVGEGRQAAAAHGVASVQ